MINESNTSIRNVANVQACVIKHAAWIRMKAATFYADRADAEDLAGETIFKCLSEGRRFDASRSFKPWALTIMANTFRVQYNRRKCVLFSGYEDASEAIGSLYSDQYAVMRSMLSVIRDCARKSLCIESVLLYAKGYDYIEIADRLKIPLGTVKSRISAGRAMLCNRL